jgi:hypothetical protein
LTTAADGVRRSQRPVRVVGVGRAGPRLDGSSPLVRTGCFRHQRGRHGQPSRSCLRPTVPRPGWSRPLGGLRPRACPGYQTGRHVARRRRIGFPLPSSRGCRSRSVRPAPPGCHWSACPSRAAGHVSARRVWRTRHSGCRAVAWLTAPGVPAPAAVALTPAAPTAGVPDAVAPTPVAPSAAVRAGFGSYPSPDAGRDVVPRRHRSGRTRPQRGGDWRTRERIDT